MLQVFCLDVAYVTIAIYTHVSSVCVCFQSHVVSVSTGCFKNRPGGAHVAMPRWLVDSGLPCTRLLLLLGRRLWVTVRAPEADRRLLGTHP
jgi:hypothetical protein